MHRAGSRLGSYRTLVLSTSQSLQHSRQRFPRSYLTVVLLTLLKFKHNCTVRGSHPKSTPVPTTGKPNLIAMHQLTLPLNPAEPQSWKLMETHGNPHAKHIMETHDSPRDQVSTNQVDQVHIKVRHPET